APRDTRTLFDAAGISDHSAWLAQYPGPLEVHHHALDDAICQARAVCAAYRRLRVMEAVRSNLAKVIWQTACEGRGGFCSSDMQDAALEAIDLALQQAEATARAAQLPND